MHVDELGYYWTGPDEFNPKYRVPTDQGNLTFSSKVREKSGNFAKCSGKF